MSYHCRRRSLLFDAGGRGYSSSSMKFHQEAVRHRSRDGATASQLLKLSRGHPQHHDRAPAAGRMFSTRRRRRRRRHTLTLKRRAARAV